VKILKAKSFFKSSFWKANISHQPSYSWRSILKAWDLLKLGCCWNNCNGDPCTSGRLSDFLFQVDTI